MGKPLDLESRASGRPEARNPQHGPPSGHGPHPGHRLRQRANVARIAGKPARGMHERATGVHEQAALPPAAPPTRMEEGEVTPPPAGVIGPAGGPG